MSESKLGGDTRLTRSELIDLAGHLVELLAGIEAAVGDPQNPSHRHETYADLSARLDPHLGRFINESAGEQIPGRKDYRLSDFLDDLEELEPVTFDSMGSPIFAHQLPPEKRT